MTGPPPAGPPPGWYPDPAGRAGQRWWDGQQWTSAEAPPPHLGPYWPAWQSPQPVAGPRKRRWGRWLIAGLVVLATLIGLGGWAAMRIVVPAGETADRYLKALERGDADTAFDEVCAGVTTRVKFEAAVADGKRISSFEMLPPQAVSTTEMRVDVAIKYGTPTVVRRQLQVVKRAEGWRVCGVRASSESSYQAPPGP